MKKNVLREYLAKREAKKLGEAFNPIMKAMVESKKNYKPRRVKQKGEE